MSEQVEGNETSSSVPGKVKSFKDLVYAGVNENPIMDTHP